MPAVVSVPLTSMLYFSIGINIALAIFNLFPLPPLDGSKVLMGFLPEDMANEYAKVEPFGLLILVALLYTGVLSGILWPMMRIVRDFLLGIFFNRDRTGMEQGPTDPKGGTYIIILFAE